MLFFLSFSGDDDALLIFLFSLLLFSPSIELEKKILESWTAVEAAESNLYKLRQETVYYYYTAPEGTLLKLSLIHI